MKIECRIKTNVDDVGLVTKMVAYTTGISSIYGTEQKEANIAYRQIPLKCLKWMRDNIILHNDTSPAKLILGGDVLVEFREIPSRRIKDIISNRANHFSNDIVVDSVSFVETSYNVHETLVKHSSPSDLTFFSEDLNCEISIREYFKRILLKLWDEGEGFSGKRPLGNSGWEHSIYETLVIHGYVDGRKVDGFHYVTNEHEARAFVQNEIINKLF